jgi:hypothetical protein
VIRNMDGPFSFSRGIQSVGVRVGFEEKEMRVLALALTLALFLYPEPGSNRHSIAATGV